jgi:ribosomal protein S18 acetylase RimI-like enzyme
VDVAVDERLVGELERCALAAWPAEEIRSLGTWRLRYTRGVTRRANSAWVDGGGDLPALVEAAERFYAERGQPCLFQVTPLAPAALDPLLEARGYEREAPVSIQIADADLPAAPVAVRTEATISDAWFAVAASGRFAAVADVYRALLTRIGSRAVYALAGTGAVGLGVVDPPWMGIFNMFTVPDQRRRGLARAVLQALAAAGRARGATRLYLQVESDNRTARALYASAGFREVYGYHYRRGQGRGTPSLSAEGASAGKMVG